MEGRFYMSEKEVYRLEIIKQLEAKKLKISKAAKLLRISVRQVGRLRKEYKSNGAKGLVSKKIGTAGNHRMSEKQEKIVLKFFDKEEFRDFSPTLAHEYMKECWGLSVSVSSVRNIMIRHKIWEPCSKRKPKIHHLRERRSMLGELVQLDGSDHDWFEGRGPRCTLLVYVDDATSQILFLKFARSENTEDYFIATRGYIEKCGAPQAFYVDKHSVFKINSKGCLSGEGKTQFTRAMGELGIQMICANSPQAKGRVERRNRDLQDRLVKALRIAKISTIEAANDFTESFLERFNQKFGKTPKSALNAHKPILSTQNLDKIFCFKNIRYLSKNHTFQYENVVYQVYADKQENRLRNAKVEVFKGLDGKVTIEKDGKGLRAIPSRELEIPLEEASRKELAEVLERSVKGKKRPIPPISHPWKRGRMNPHPSS